MSTSSAGRAARPAQPMTRALAWASRAALVLAAADLGTLGGLLDHATALAALSDPDAASVVPKDAGGLGMLLGVVAGIGYGVWPVGSVSDRHPAELAALRLLGRSLLVLHVPVLILLALDVAAHGGAVVVFVLVSAPVSVLATPLLLPLARFRPDAKETAAPLRNSAPPPPSPAVSPAVALLLPFVAAFSAGRPVLGLLTLVLWAGAVVLAFVAPLRAIVPFVAASALGAQLARREGFRRAPGVRPPVIPPAVRLGTLNVAGLLAVPPLYALDAVAAAVLIALARAPTLGAFASIVQGSMLVLLVALPFTLLPLMVALPFAGRRTEPFRKAASLLLALGHAALAAALAEAAFVASAGYAAPVRAILAPLAWALVLTLPLAALLAASATGRTRVA